MTPDTSPSGLEPAASLASVRIRRRKPPLAPSGKRGDLTAETAPGAPRAPIIALPPPAREPMLPGIPPMVELLPPAPAIEAPTPEPANDVDPAALLTEAETLELLLAPPDETEQPPDEPAMTHDDPAPQFLAPAPAEPPPALIPVEAPPVEPAVTAPDDPLPEPQAPTETEPRPAPILAEAPPAEPAEAEPPAESGAGDLLDYWDSLRGGRDFPALDELDRIHVAGTWPNTVLLAIEASDLPRITRLGEGNGEIEYTATVIDWIMSRGRSAVKHGEPIEEERRFPLSDGSARYRLLLLPFSSYGLKCDHVLGQLSREAELGAVASFKRWLAS